MLYLATCEICGLILTSRSGGEIIRENMRNAVKVQDRKSYVSHSVGNGGDWPWAATVPSASFSRSSNFTLVNEKCTRVAPSAHDTQLTFSETVNIQ